MKNKRGRARGVAIFLVSVAIILVAIALCVLLSSAFSTSKKCSFTQVPYTITQPETIKECHQETLLYSYHASFDKERVENKKNRREYWVYLTIKNDDNLSGQFKFRNFYYDYNCEDESWYWNKYWKYNDDNLQYWRYYIYSTNRDCKDSREEWKTVYLNPGEEKTFSYSIVLSKYSDREDYSPEIIAPSKEVCETITKTKEVTAYRTQEIC